MRKLLVIIVILTSLGNGLVQAQIDTDRMTIIGRNALYFEDYVLAIQYFNQVISAKPYLSEPYYYRAMGKYHLDDFSGAEQDCSKSLEINPYYVDAYNLRGIVRQRLGKNKEAISDFKKGLEFDPENVNLIVNIGIAQINEGQYEKAIETYSKAIGLAPNLANAWINRGHAKAASSDTIGALEDLTQAIKVNPYIPDGYASRAIVNYQLGEFEKSLNDLNEAIELRPDDARLYMNRGIISYQLDDLQGTVDDFDKVIKLEPRNAMAYSNRGILRAQIGDTNRAIEDFSRVLALNPQDLLTLYYRAVLYMETGEMENALADFNIIADNYPDFAPVYFNRSQIKQLLGDTNGAALDYGTAVKLEMERRETSDEAEAAAALADASDTRPDDQEDADRKPTRSESDQDIRNYDKIAVLDDFDTDQAEQLDYGSLRGRIQDRNIVIDLEPIFGLTYYPGDTLVHRLRYFNIDVDAFNRKELINQPIQIANIEKELERQQSAKVFETINKINNNKIPQANNLEKAELLLSRGALYQAVMNLNNAMDDYNKSLELNPQNYLVLFSRAFTRFKMVQMVRTLQEETPDPQPELKLRGAGTSTTSTRQIQPSKEPDQQILDYDLIIEDLESILQIKPDFPFAYYNIGVIEAYKRNFEIAVEYFSKAIEINPQLAEAWFNRGLIRIFLEEEKKGTLDLSKAGELGIFKAYNVIKRYGIGPGAQQPQEEEGE